MKAVIYHNPRCSKSRETLAILQGAGAEIEIIEYLKTPPTATELSRLSTLAGLSPRGILRRGEAAATGLAGADDARIIDAMTLEPILIQRPIVETTRGVRVCRPPEIVHEIL